MDFLIFICSAVAALGAYLFGFGHGCQRTRNRFKAQSGQWHQLQDEMELIGREVERQNWSRTGGN